MNAPVATWTRRILMIALYAAGFVLLAVTLPVLLVLAAAFDAGRGKPWVTARALLFLVWSLTCELAGLLAAALLWLAGPILAGGSGERWRRWNFALQHWWMRMLGEGALRVFDLRLEVDDGGYEYDGTPVLVFLRHATAADFLLPSLVMPAPLGVGLRYVFKRELLRNPFIDVVGSRLPNVFVLRESVQTPREVAAVAALGRGLAGGQGAVMYPEGTRFSAGRRVRIIERLRERGRDLDAREAAALHHVLPPGSGGALALLDAAPGADVIFVAHTGLEGASSVHRFFRGGLVGKTVHAQLRAFKAADIPRHPAARRAWLMDQWHQVDEFIDDHHAGPRKRRRPQPRPLRLVHGHRGTSRADGSGASG